MGGIRSDLCRPPCPARLRRARPRSRRGLSGNQRSGKGNAGGDPLHRPCLRCCCQRGSKALGEEHSGNRGGEVEARDPLAHRDREAAVSTLQQLRAEPVALGSEGEDGAGESAAASSASPSGSIATSGRSLSGRPSIAATGRAKWRPAAPRNASGCQGSLLPVVSTPAASAAAATRTQAPMFPIVRGSSSRTRGAGRLSPRASAKSTAGRRAIATTPVRGACGTSWASTSASTGVTRSASDPARSGASSAASRSSSPRLAAPPPRPARRRSAARA